MICLVGPLGKAMSPPPSFSISFFMLSYIIHLTVRRYQIQCSRSSINNTWIISEIFLWRGLLMSLSWHAFSSLMSSAVSVSDQFYMKVKKGPRPQSSVLLVFKFKMKVCVQKRKISLRKSTLQIAQHDVVANYRNLLSTVLPDFSKHEDKEFLL